MLKHYLNEAKLKLKDEAFEDALDASSKALELDGMNFQALMLKGKCLFHLKNATLAEATYRRAVDLQPDLPIVWKGLLEVYEMTNAHAKAIEPLEKLSAILMTNDKWDRCQKIFADLAAAATAASVVPKALHAWFPLVVSVADKPALFLGAFPNQDVPSEIQIWINVLHLVQTHRTLGPFRSVDFILENIVRLVATVSWANEDFKQDEEAAKNASWAPPSAAATLRLDVAGAVDIAVENAWQKVKQAPCEAKPAARQALDALVAHLVRSCPRAKRAAEVRLLRIEDADADVLSPAEEEQCLAVLKSTASSTTSPLLHLYCGLDHANEGQFSEAVSSILQGIPSLPEHIQARVVLATLSLESASFDPQRCLDMVHAAQDAVQYRFDKFGTSPRSYSHTAMQLLQAKAWIALRNWASAIVVYEGIIEHEPFLPDAVLGLAEAHLHQDNVDAAALTLQFLPPQESAAYCAAKGWLMYRQGDLAGAHTTLEGGLAYPDVSWALKYRLARVYWDLGGEYQANKAYCVAQLVGAAKLNPHEPVIFRWLGSYYLNIGGDPARAEKCFFKALSLDPSCEFCGIALTELYANDYDRAVQLWTDMAVGQDRVHAPWALLRLAQHDVTHGNDSAIGHLHKLLRVDPHNASLWAALGHVYQVFGRIVAAQKSYVKSLALVEAAGDKRPSDSVLCELARIELSLGLLDEALAHLTTAAGAVDACNDQTNVGAAVHKLLAETLFTQAKTLCAQGLYGRSRDKLKHSSTVLRSYLAAIGARKAHTSLYKLLGDIHLFSFYLPPDETWISFLQQGTEAYLTALSKAPTNALALFDAGVACWIQAQAKGFLLNVPMAKWSLQHLPTYPTEIQSLVATARSYLTRSLQTHPNDAKVWNALGAVHEHVILKQFAFVRAIELDNLDAAWANLGMLYLQSGHLGLAQKAFLSLQGVNPNHPAMWLGYGLMECVNRDPAQAHAAFTCAMELRLDLDILHGFAYTGLVSRTGSLDQALFALKKYHERDARDPAATNSLGVALMRTNLYPQAISAFESTLDMVQNDPSLVDGVSLNLVQALLHAKNYDAAESVLESLAKPSPAPLPLLPLLQTMVHVGRGGHDKDALAILNEATKCLPSSLSESNVVKVHLARSVLLYRVGEQDASRESLLQLLQNQPTHSDAIATVLIKLGGASAWWSPTDTTITHALCGPLVALYQQLNMGAACKRMCDYWTTTFPNDPNGWLALAQSSLHFGKLQGIPTSVPLPPVLSTVLPYEATLLRHQIESVEELFGSWHASDTAVRKWLHLHPVDPLAPLLIVMSLLKQLAIHPDDTSLLCQANTWLDSYATNESATPYGTWLWHVLQSNLHASRDKSKAHLHAQAAKALVTTTLSGHVPVRLYQARSVVHTDPDDAIALYLSSLHEEGALKVAKVELAVLLETKGYLKTAWRLWKDVDTADSDKNEWKGLVAIKRCFLQRENAKLAAKFVRDMPAVSDAFVEAFKIEFRLE
ncbi:hypothetical protein H310_08624 [Aphanomyces invadans]|uniref:TPR-like protein n=1 Tax=Aphanomyces invadans TaxID=157072 RepID=A0A024TXY8_9STRA|nr:hypothetical protein H310_08624 [Aphanomyces invadans]ETV98486.1 hypothetical protein H310_08624 [Aphanomyces invadans]|eukprot:XP_008872683.1 hypothetical protein H310_08624 [Aphanomyces invadans]